MITLTPSEPRSSVVAVGAADDLDRGIDGFLEADQRQ